MSIPLVQNNNKDSINTSLIAIKKQLERINMLLGLSNSEEIDTSVFATKEELEDAVIQVETELAPVDEVTLNNMQSVTSNAVAGEVNTINGNISTINNDLNLCMQPRIAGERMTNSQFQNRIYNNGNATACCGSVNLSDGPDGDMWISFIYIPHRTGIGGDNPLYGTIIATAMTTNNTKIFIKHLIAGVWYGWQTK